MFFSIAAIANQQIDNINPIPGENSFGNAYTGTIKKVFNPPLVALGQTGIFYSTVSYTGPTIQTQYHEQVPDSIGSNFSCNYVGASSNEQDLFKNYSINHRTEVGARYISNTTIALLEEEILPPSFVVPDFINFYPYIFCASRSAAISPDRFEGQANYVSQYSQSTQSIIPLNIYLQGSATFVSRTSRESNKFLNVFYPLANTGVRYISTTTNQV